MREGVMSRRTHALSAAQASSPPFRNPVGCQSVTHTLQTLVALYAAILRAGPHTAFVGLHCPCGPLRDPVGPGGFGALAGLFGIREAFDLARQERGVYHRARGMKRQIKGLRSERCLPRADRLTWFRSGISGMVGSKLRGDKVDQQKQKVGHPPPAATHTMAYDLYFRFLCLLAPLRGGAASNPSKLAAAPRVFPSCSQTPRDPLSPSTPSISASSPFRLLPFLPIPTPYPSARASSSSLRRFASRFEVTSRVMLSSSYRSIRANSAARLVETELLGPLLARTDKPDVVSVTGAPAIEAANSRSKTGAPRFRSLRSCR